ncbi:uncharacterized protein LOC6541639 [Drosophila erecta]|uniref:uncharacterized protein LOC6541639 n=1 Tax=Drosophila erecta TaxID=7220 RepID=UPI000F04B932|nr:uncharacterized protein LOC6541639 [Drosophila erecta]
MSLPKIPHIVGDDDESQGALKSAPESDENTNESSMESEQDDDNEDEMDLDDVDWSPYVTYEAGAPRRPYNTLKITEITEVPRNAVENSPSPKMDLLKPETSESHCLGVRKRLIISRANYAPSETIGARVSRRSRGSWAAYSHSILTAPETSDDTTSVLPDELAKPRDVTEFFHRISVGLVEQRVCLKPFLDLRKRIALMVTQTLKESKRMSK